MRLPRPALAVLLPAALTLSACAPTPPPTDEAPTVTTQRARAVTQELQPVPTEHWLDPRAERRNKANRKAWMAEMHRAAPGTDVKAIERENGYRLTELRAQWAAQKDFVPDTWTERGSRNQAGRMHSVALGLDGTTLYGGSSRGGTWRTDPDGNSWTPLSDNLWGGAHHVAVGASPAETLVGLTNGGRLRYSLDQGDTWLAPTGLPGDMNQGRRLLTDPADRSLMYLLLGRPGNQEELHRSQDGGLSWTLVRSLAGDGDVWLDRVDGGTLWLLDETDIWRSDDLGDNWTMEGTVTGGGVGDVRLAGSEAGAPTLYAALRDGAGWHLHRSDDAGANWTFASDIPDFWGTLCASISDPMLVATGGVEVYRSEDGGVTPVLVNPWGEYYQNPIERLHADTPGMHVLMVGGIETWFISTDGGLFRSQDGLLSVYNISQFGLGVSQYYSTLTDRRDPNRVAAGAQDQGYQISTGVGGAGTLYDFDQIISGDYGHLTSGDRTLDWVFSTYPGFILVQQGWERPDLALLDFPMGANLLWLPPVVADPTTTTAFYLCADRLWRYERQPDETWASFMETPQDFTTGGSAYLSALSISRADPTRRIAVTDTGRFWFSSDSGLGWDLSPDTGPSSHYFYGNALAHSWDDPLVAYAGGSGYSGPGVYRTVDGGQTWQPVGGGLPQTMVYDLAWEGPGSAVVYAATESGPYRLDPGTDTWEYIGSTVAPLTTYWSVESVPEVGLIRFGTYGRGIWDWQAVVVPETGRCDDEVDNEGDGLVDCADEDCVGVPECLEDCASLEDEDLDGLVDCEDPDCVGEPECLEDCWNGADDDLDGDVDCDDADCYVYDQDGDGHADCAECAPFDPALFAVPPETEDLRVAKLAPDGATVRLSWSDSAVLASGSAARHDVIGGEIAALRSSGWPASADCLAENLDVLEHDDDRPDVVGAWYLVRTQNDCGSGPWGASTLADRLPTPGCR